MKVPQDSQPLLELNSLQKLRNQRKLLNGIDLTVRRGEIAMIVGRSGSGKTTLLRICALTDRDYLGKLMIDKIDPFASRLDAYFRLVKIGYIPQFHDLLDHLTVIENVEFPLLLQGMKRNECRKMVEEVIKRLGIESIPDKFPSEISGGEAQRVAIARALVKKPQLVIADEPVSSLDSGLEALVFQEFRKLADKGSCILVSSTQSEPSYIEQVDTIYFMNDGTLHRKGD